MAGKTFVFKSHAFAIYTPSQLCDLKSDHLQRTWRQRSCASLRNQTSAALFQLLNPSVAFSYLLAAEALRSRTYLQNRGQI